jgi:TetR/AcrR family transcriptional regulator, mexJK operon transcriptional repressor
MSSSPSRRPSRASGRRESPAAATAAGPDERNHRTGDAPATSADSGEDQQRAAADHREDKQRAAADHREDERASASDDRDREDEGRSARKRRAIMEAATTLFLRNGYQGTSMDDIAALAAVSKQTVYKNFADKQGLFSDITLGITATAEDFTKTVTMMLDGTDDLERDLGELARRYIASVMQPEVLRLRRLVIGEAGRFPELARTYYQRAPERVLATLAACLERLAGRGLLRLEDPMLAANHLAFLILSPIDKAMFSGVDERPAAAELDRLADAGVRVFLAAYRA